MKILLDTCVISELHRKSGNSNVRAAVAAHRPEDLFLSVITIGEITKGVLRLPSCKKKSDLIDWLQALDQDFAARVLNIDRDTVAVWGELTALAEFRGKTLPIADGLIAATAVQHGLRIYTRNTTDFESTGVLLTNPWAT